MVPPALAKLSISSPQGREALLVDLVGVAFLGQAHALDAQEASVSFPEPRAALATTNPTVALSGFR